MVEHTVKFFVSKFLGLSLLAALGLTSCDSKQRGGDLKRSNVLVTEEEPAVEEFVAPEVEVQRTISIFSPQTYLQSRGIFSLMVNSSDVRNTSFDVVNSSLETHLIGKNQGLFAGIVVTSTKTGIHTSINIADSLAVAALRYGENVLVVDPEISDSQVPTTSVYILDFPIFGMSTTFFTTDKQISDGVFQGWSSVLQSPVVYSDDGTVMTINVADIINR